MDLEQRFDMFRQQVCDELEKFRLELWRHQDRLDSRQRAEEIVQLVLADDGVLIPPDQAHPSHELGVEEMDNYGEERVCCLRCGATPYDGFNQMCPRVSRVPS